MALHYLDVNSFLCLVIWVEKVYLWAS